MAPTREFTVAVFVVHRDRVLLHYHRKLNMWLPPGGHIEPNELPDDAALREVAEETGLRCRLLDELPATMYADRHGRPKRVRYWRMAVVAEDPFEPDDEVDELRWLDRDGALATLTYVHDREIVAAAL